MTSLLMGVDAGASHTEAVLGEEGLRVMDRWRGGPGALRPGAEPEAVRVWTEAIAQVLERFGKRGQRMAVVVGAAGAGNETSRLQAERLLGGALGPTAQVRVTTDGEIALEAAFPDDVPGIVVMAGSGSIAYARTPRGTVRRVGGLGWVMGDEGSGFALAREALRRVGQTADGRAAATVLSTALPRAVGVTSIVELVQWSLGASPREMAALAEVVCRSADDGDEAARGLVGEAAADLAQLVDALLPSPPSEGTGLALGGGLLGRESAVRVRLVDVLGQRHPGVAVQADPVDPLVGALRLASRL